MNDPRMTTFRHRLPGVVYGGDYNPEQWPKEVWQEDVRLMRAAGVRLVSLGVFSWAMLEPADGRFDFSWLDEIMDLLWANGIHVNLATPNAAPPPWLATDFPETLSVDRQGVRHGIGSRGHFCPSSPVYRDRSRRIATKLAERYGKHPALAMWHIGNEYHSDCYCDLCDDRFRTWLRQRHGTLDELNHRQDKATVTLDRSGTDLLTGRRLAAGETLVLDAADVAVVRSPLATPQQAEPPSSGS